MRFDSDGAANLGADLRVRPDKFIRGGFKLTGNSLRNYKR